MLGDYLSIQRVMLEAREWPGMVRLGYVWKVEPAGFADQLEAWGGRKALRMTPRVSA